MTTLVPLRQMEDLQFRFEEQGVISGDQLESVAGDRETVITDLQSQLDQERKNTARLQEQLQVSEWIVHGTDFVRS